MAKPVERVVTEGILNDFVTLGYLRRPSIPKAWNRVGDLVQIGFVGLLKAASRYDPGM